MTQPPTQQHQRYTSLGSQNSTSLLPSSPHLQQQPKRLFTPPSMARSIYSSSASRPSYESLELSYDEQIETLEESVNPHRSPLYIFMLAIIVGGLQLSWSTEFAEGTPFLLSLGISKHTLALIWIAGPLSGALGQPIVGLFSDNSMNHKGRRRGFIITGCFSTVCSLLALSYSVDILGLFFPKGTGLDEIKHATIPFAAISIYAMDFSIAVIQASSRAYIVDNVPTHQQQIANGFAAVLIGFFNILGFFFGAIELTYWFPFLGVNQFNVLAAIASLALIITTVSSLAYVKERNPNTDPVMIKERERTKLRLAELGLEDPDSTLQMVKFLYLQTMNSINRLSPQVKIVCIVEFFAWIGYFPMLFYTTTYVGELYKFEFWSARDPGLPPLNDSELQWLDDESVRRGSLALLLHSITSFSIDILLPLLTKPVKLSSAPSQPEDQFSSRSKFLQTIERFRLTYAPNLTVRHTWILSHVIFILCMASTFLITNSTLAIIMFAVLGLPWGVALWTPFVLISEEISRIKEVKLKLHHHQITDNHHQGVEDIGFKDLVKKFENYEHEAGVILGLHNFFVAAPQMLTTLLSSLLFALLTPRGSESTAGSSYGPDEYDGSIAWVFRFGGVAAFIALWWSFKVKKDDELWGEVELMEGVLREGQAEGV